MAYIADTSGINVNLFRKTQLEYFVNIWLCFCSGFHLLLRRRGLLGKP